MSGDVWNKCTSSSYIVTVRRGNATKTLQTNTGARYTRTSETFILLYNGWKGGQIFQFFHILLLKYYEEGEFFEIPTKYMYVCFSYRGSGLFARLSTITYDRLWPQLKLHVIQYKSWSRGNCSVSPLPHIPQWGRCHCWARREGQISHWVHYLKVRRHCFVKISISQKT